MDRLQMFAMNIFLLIGLLIAAGLLLVVVIATWTGVRVWLFQRDQKRGEEEFRSGRVDRDGRQLPPTGRGTCEMCGRVLEKICFLPDGRRLCTTCRSTAAPS